VRKRSLLGRAITALAHRRPRNAPTRRGFRRRRHGRRRASDRSETNYRSIPCGALAEDRSIFTWRGVRPPDGSELTPDARIGGKLVVGKGDCLRLGAARGTCPPGPRVLTGRQRRRGPSPRRWRSHRGGCERCVTAGGGETRRGEAGPEYCQTRRELDLPDGCKGLCGGWLPDTRVEC
jgi:hypothetical protein